MCLCKPCKTFLNMVNWKQQIAQRGFYMKRICIVFVVLLLFPYFNMFVWTPSEPDAMSSQASALSTESSSASASPYYLAAIGADDTAAVLDGYPVKETVIAVIDTGAELSHEDLVDSLWINEAERNGTDNVDDDGNGYIDDIYGVDFINNVPTPAPDNPSAPLRYEAPEDDSNTSHGTHVSGIIGMNPDNAVGYAGVGYRTKIMILKAGNYKNSFSFANAAKAVQYAVANGADVINMSFGSYNENSTFAEELEKASSSCLLVAAAGNNGRASSSSTMYPAAYPYVIGVMAGNTTDGCWTSSNFVDTSPAPYDILCPGEAILSTTFLSATSFSYVLLRLIGKHDRIRTAPLEEEETITYVKSIREAVEYLEKTSGNILVTTGSKELSAYTALTDYQERIYARVLSLVEVVSSCAKLGIEGKHLLCMQGPFSREMNIALIHQFDIAWMVSKESGRAGRSSWKNIGGKRNRLPDDCHRTTEGRTGHGTGEMYRVSGPPFSLERKCCK